MDYDRDYDNGTTNTVVGTTTNTADLEYGDEPIHDQLPSVEEYKSNLVDGGTPRSGSGMSIPVNSSINAVSKDYDDDTNEEDDTEEYRHDQLPSVEEARAALRATSNDWGCLHYFAIFVGLVVVSVAIVVPVIVNRKAAPTDSLRTAPPPIVAPNFAPIPTSTVPPLQRQESIVSHLVNLGISTEEDLTTNGTPQNKALTWMSFDDELRPRVPSTSKTYSHFVERYVLAVFYFATNGPSWTYKLKFLSGIDHCDWRGDFLTNTGSRVRLGVSSCSSVAESIEATAGNMATELSFPLNGLSGTFPSEIQFLHRLETIYTPFNSQLTGDLLFGLPNLDRLGSFEAQYCALTGTIPSEIGNLSRLTNLGLGNNDLEGSLPDSLYELVNLELLGLDDNMFEGSIAPLGQLTNLKKAYLEDNFFTGELTEELATAWSDQLEELDLSGNNLNSTIPAGFFSLPNLFVMDLHGNSLRGSIPDIAPNNTELRFLALHANDLTGQIPVSISNLESLRHLDLAKNQLNTPIPATMGQLTQLRYLFTGQNDFSDHEMPEFLWSLTLLRELSMKSNRITGTIPSQIRTLTSLQLLDLDSNRLTGTIPKEIGLLAGLDHLLLNRNSLSGTLPSTFTLLYDLNMLLIDSNKINGTADVICTDENIDLNYFVADCEGPIVNIECSCCDLCCNDLNATCNNLGWHVNLDPIWEYGYTRSSYQFSSEVVPP